MHANLKGEVVALNHGFSVVLLKGDGLGLLYFCLELRGKHVFYTVNGIVNLITQVQSLILIGRKTKKGSRGREKHQDVVGEAVMMNYSQRES